MVSRKTRCNSEVVWLQIIELFHASSAKEYIISLLLVVDLLGMVDLTKRISSSDIYVVLVDFRVDFVFKRSFFVE